jgi:hypothetical protein
MQEERLPALRAWRRCAPGGVARLAALRAWQRCAPGGAARLVALRAWRRDAPGGAARLAALQARRRCAPGGAARLAALLRAQNAQRSAFGTFLTSQSAFGTQKMKFEKIDFLPFLRFSKFWMSQFHNFTPFCTVFYYSAP